METIIFILVCWFLIFIEAITDSLTYVGWTESSKKAGVFAHIFQIVLIILSIISGMILNKIGINFTFINCLLMLITAASWHELLFDRFYNLLLNKDGIGTTSFRDQLWGKLGIKVNSLGYNILILSIVFGLTVLLSMRIS